MDGQSQKWNNMYKIYRMIFRVFSIFITCNIKNMERVGIMNKWPVITGDIW